MLFSSPPYYNNQIILTLILISSLLSLLTPSRSQMSIREMARVVQVRERENCNSRHFSKLIKSSCCPHPTSLSFVPPQPKLSTSVFRNTPTSIHSLPDDIVYDILSRVSLHSLPSVSAVCRRWAQLIDSESFSLLRRNHHRLQPTLFAFSLGNAASFCSLRLFSDVSWDVSGNKGVSFRGDVSHARVTAVGRKVVMISRFSCLVFDPWTRLVKSRSAPILPRKRFAVATVNGKVYVAGGSPHASSVEEFNPDSNEWRVVSDAPRRRYGCIGVGVDGVFYVIGGLKIGGASDTRVAISGAEARGYASSMDLYDVVACGWLRSRVVPGGGCVVAACGTRDHVYILSSHAVELSFWRFNAIRKGGSGFGEWCRMKGPPLPAQVRLGGTVKFSCVAAEEKVVLIQVMGSVDDLLRRNGRNVRGNYKQGLVLIFDCVSEVWSRGPDLPHVVHRTGCVCVDN